MALAKCWAWIEERAGSEGLGDLVIERATSSLARAERLGMDVERPTFELAAASEALVRARVVVHAFSEKEVQKVIAEGTEVSSDVEKAALAKLAEYAYRRKGLVVASAMLLLFAGLLALKARRLERARQPPYLRQALPEVGCRDADPDSIRPSRRQPGGARSPGRRNTPSLEACYSCHQNMRGPFLWEHSPCARIGLTYHKSHGSNYPQLLQARVTQLCQSCPQQGRHQRLPGLPPSVWVGKGVAPVGKKGRLRADVNYQRFSGDWTPENLATPDINNAIAYPFPEPSDRTLTARASFLGTSPAR